MISDLCKIVLFTFQNVNYHTNITSVCFHSFVMITDFISGSLKQGFSYCIVLNSINCENNILSFLSLLGYSDIGVIISIIVQS